MTQHTHADGRPAPGLPESARTFFAGIAFAAAAVSAVAIVLGGETRGWAAFVVLVAASSVAQYYSFHTIRNQVFHTTPLFFVAGVLLLPPELLVVLPLIAHIPDWLRKRYAWYIQSFNIANFTLAVMSAWVAARAVGSALEGRSGSWAASAAVAALTYFALNNAGFAAILYLARGHRPSQTLNTQLLAADASLACLGVALATFWRADSWLIPFALTPIFLLHASLHLPQLQEEARVDAKTGLANARHFMEALSDELERARRFGRPLSVIVADLDLLRNINNTYGHLAGDAVLSGIAAVLRAQLRDYDIAARFGGEEFAVVLPETSCAEAREIAERIREAAATTPIWAESARQHITATLSIGVACFPTFGPDPDDLIHSADLAAYRAKLQGRNRVRRATRRGALTAVDELAPQKDVPTKPAASVAGQRLSGTRLLVGAAVLVCAGVGLGAAIPASAGHAIGLLACAAVVVAACVAAVLAIRRTRKTDDSLSRVNRLLKERSTAALASLSSIVDKRDADMAGHSRRVRDLALAMGRQLGLSDVELRLLGHAALFHDIGKLTVPDAVLLKPGALSASEWTVMRHHSEEGARIVRRLGFLEDAVPSILHHHERVDGRGYPKGLAGGEIPLGARIIHVADAYDAMRTNRVYRPARSDQDALDELRRLAGSQFDPQCVRALEDALAAGTFADAPGGRPIALRADTVA